MIHRDVIIVGAGPAGSSCASALKKAGLDGLLIDKHPFPRAKPCAGWITPAVMQDLQLDPDQYPHGLTHYRSFQVSIKGFRFQLPTRQYAIRRLEFDAWLIKKADTPLIEHQVNQIERKDDGYLIDGEYHCRYLVGAGGTYCPVRKAFFNTGPFSRQQEQIVALEEEFIYPDADPRCHLWFMENGLPGYSWYVPKTGGYVNVGVGGKARDLKRNSDSIRRHWELVKTSIEKLGLVKNHLYKPEAHTYYLRRSLENLRFENTFLVGDSAGLATPDMGEGIGAAIRSGLAAAEAIINGGEYNLTKVPQFSFWSILTSH